MTRLETRHLANLQFPEVSRALRALSSAYVERRHTAIAAGRVLDGAGKRAAFALYYAPLHFLSTERVLSELLDHAAEALTAPPVIDLGCGTGSVGAAAAAVTGSRTILGIDTHPWALDEARDTYAAFALSASLTRGSAARMRRPRSRSLIVAGYVANEMPEAERHQLRDALADAVRHGSRVLVIEPLSKSAAPWWPEWVKCFAPLGARADEWKLALSPPPLVRRLGEAAGLTSTQANVRSLWV
jgi:tRNA/tmRNA/rRNA uracil-C5-methylase (TrmA/RlmC/RlmD family)